MSKFSIGLSLALLVPAMLSCKSRGSSGLASTKDPLDGLDVNPEVPITKFENPPIDEASDIEKIMNVTKAIQQALHDKGEKVYRFTHSRTIGCAAAKFMVDKDLPKDLQVGLFAQPGAEYKTWARFSNQMGFVDSDDSPDNRAMSLKLMGVHGPKLLNDGGLDTRTLDFVMTQGQSFFMDTAKDFLEIVSAGLPGGIGVMTWFQQHPKFTKQRQDLIELGAIGSLFDGSYTAMSPFLFGKDRAVRFLADTCKNQNTPPGKGKTHLTEQLKKDLTNPEGHCFDFSVMFFKNEQETPVEKGSEHDWKQPKRHVAKIIFPPQDPKIVDQRQEFCEELQLSPWRTLPEHQPLGGLNRVRRHAYWGLGSNRHRLNGTKIQEPTEADFPL